MQSLEEIFFRPQKNIFFPCIRKSTDYNSVLVNFSASSSSLSCSQHFCARRRQESFFSTETLIHRIP